MSSFLTEYPQTLAALRAQYSPHFCSAYTRWIIGHQLRQTRPLCFADDTALCDLIYTEDETAYREEILSFTEYCEQNFLRLNVSKTREMILDFRQNTVPPSRLFINGAVVERVTEYKYLGFVLDNK